MIGAWLAAAPVVAQDRPSEAELFGGDAASAAEAADADAGAPLPLEDETSGPAGAASGSLEQSGAATPAASAAEARDEAVLGPRATPMFTEPAAPADPLSIGGQIYLRAQTSALEGRSVDEWAYSMPWLLDVYFDARPNDRVRGFVLGRLSYDPTIGDGGAVSPLDVDPTAGSPSVSSLFGRRSGEPRVLLDQLWLRFDLAHTLFVTAGKQHVRWGTARFWSPTDYLHLRRRNPLDVFDARTGTAMLKLHLPIESEAWNFYAYLVPEGPGGAPTLSRIAAAARAEIVLGQTEIGLGVFARKGSHAKFAADVSTGIGDIDFYAEAALRDRADVDFIRYRPDAALPDLPEPEPWQAPNEIASQALEDFVEARYPLQPRGGYRPQLVAGLSHTRKYNDTDTFTIGAEYFYNAFGYGDPDVYPGLLLPRSPSLQDPASFFYLGQHYAALFVVFPAPFKLDLHTFTLSTLGNLSDRSFITRLDYSLLVLTHLRFEAFAAVHYGRDNGEFRFGFGEIAVAGIEFSQPPGLFDLGVALRLAI